LIQEGEINFDASAGKSVGCRDIPWAYSTAAARISLSACAISPRFGRLEQSDSVSVSEEFINLAHINPLRRNVGSKFRSLVSDHEFCPPAATCCLYPGEAHKCRDAPERR
jgi:hypothetical protein